MIRNGNVNQGLNPLDSQGYWMLVDQSGQGQTWQGSAKPMQNVDGNLQPVEDTSAGEMADPIAAAQQQRIFNRYAKLKEYGERTQRILQDLNSGAQAVQAYGLGPVLPLSALGVDSSTGARAAGLNPVGFALPSVPQAFAARALASGVDTSGQAQQAAQTAPLASQGDLGGRLQQLDSNRWRYNAPDWAKS